MREIIMHRINKEEFEKLVSLGIKKIPSEFIQKLKNVAIVIEEEPSPEQIKKLRVGKQDLLFGLYEGVPQIKRTAHYCALPDKITIFKHPIEQFASSLEQVEEIVKNTVWHEIAHHFGSTEKRLKTLKRH